MADRPMDATELSAASRRMFLAGTAALLGSAGTTARAAPYPLPVQEQTRLFMNLFTRMAARVELPRGRSSLFVIDTGAQSTSISDTLAKALELEQGPPLTIHSVTATSQVPSAILPQLSIMTRSYGQVVVPVFPEADLGAEGLLGLNHLQHFRLTLDIQSRRALLGDADPRGYAFVSEGNALASLRRNQMVSVPARRQDGLLMMDVEVNRIPVTAFIDTGAQYSVANLPLLQAMGLSRHLGPPLVLQGVSGPPMEVHTGPAPEIRLGRRRGLQVPVLYGDLHIFDVLGIAAGPALLIGADILSRFKQVRIDYHANRIELGEVLRGARGPMASTP